MSKAQAKISGKPEANIGSIFLNICMLDIVIVYFVFSELCLLVRDLFLG